MLESNVRSLPLLKRGKVRDVYDLGDRLLIVATDRISAFDVVFPTPVPDKGAVLTAMSAFWFSKTRGIIGNHCLGTDVSGLGLSADESDALSSRSMVVRKTEPLAIECVVRGYLSGSGWSEYRRSGEVCGIPLPAGLRESDRLPEPVFTPATKAEIGDHDENITFARAADLVGADLAGRARDTSIELYRFAADYARQRGIIIADTKFEFGLVGGELILIDEALTPDSSRFWPADHYAPGGAQPSLDKQYVRDYLEEIGWNKEPPAPPLPEEVVRRTSEIYRLALERLTAEMDD